MKNLLQRLLPSVIVALLLLFTVQKQAFATCGVYHANSCPDPLHYCSGSGVGLARRVTCCTTKEECSAQPSTFLATGSATLPPLTSTCALLKEDVQGTCFDCVNKENHVWTAIGCVDASSTGIVNTFTKLGVGIAGGIAFLLILFGALQIMTSSGNPEKMNAGKELITAAITGLLLIIFSVFLLQLIGVKILAIPGFT